MSLIKIEIKGVSAELVLGNYMPADPTIYKDWQEFFHYNDLIHQSQLLSDHINEIIIRQDENILFQRKDILPLKLKRQKSYCPVMEQDKYYLRTECTENAVYTAMLDIESFDISKLNIETQDYDLLFKIGESFVANLLYDGKIIELNWHNATAIGNICLLCKFDNGYLIPVYDAIKKERSKNIKDWM